MEIVSSQKWITPVAVVAAAGLVVALYKYTGRVKKSTKKTSTSSSSSSKGVFSSLYCSKPTTRSDKDDSCYGLEKSKDNKNDMRGYKMNSKGQKTTFFNRELSENDMKLIGDITPKKIDSGTTSSSSSPQPIALSSSSSGSAWNTAGTWEEKDVTSWARGHLSEMLRSVNCEIPSHQPGKVWVTSVGKIDGDASVSMIRGKKKYIYDLNTSVEWKLTCDSTVITGSLDVSEISADTTHEFIVRGINKVNSSDNKESNKLINLCINSEQSILKSCITTALDRFCLDMKSNF